MTKKEIFHQLVENGKTDNKVLFRPILMHFAANFIQKTYAEFASDYKVLVEANLRCMDEFDFDMLGLISDPYRETNAFGAPIEFIPNGVPRCKKLIIETEYDILQLKKPDVYKAERTLDRIKAGELLFRETGGSIPIIGWIEGPLAEACNLAGAENMMIQLLINPDFANRLLDKCMITAKDFAKAQINAGCEIIGIGDAICSQIDIENYNKYVKERHREIIDYIHQSGGKVKLHICGDTNHLLEAYRDLNIDILDLDWQVNVFNARKVLGDEIILTGNINPVIVQNSSYDEVYHQCSELVRKYKSGRYILSAGCEITVLTPIRNLKAISKSTYA